jgi:hypothetical protein
MSVLNWGRILTGCILVSCVVPLGLRAQAREGTAIAGLVITQSKEETKAKGGSTQGPLFIDETSFSRVLKAATGDDLDLGSVANIVSGTVIPAPSDKIVCGDFFAHVCRVAENGLLVTIESLSLGASSADAIVTCKFNVRAGPKRDIPELAFVRVHLILERNGSSWNVKRRETLARS